jgi:hypothetical protein
MPMKRLIKQLGIFSACVLLPASVAAQDTLPTRISYTLSAEAAVGTGDFTAYQLVTNRHHVLSVRPNTAYMRGAVNIAHTLAANTVLSGCIDAIASVHADHSTYLQQCYANLSYKSLFLEVGAREEQPVLRDDLLSSGAFAKGTNAKPVPQVHIGTNGFVDVPFTRGWLQANFDGGYGKALDGDYRERAFYRGEDVNYSYATGIWYHQKHLYFRTNPTKKFFVTAGIDHVVQFAGTKHDYAIKDAPTTIEKSLNFKTFYNVILPVGDKNYFEHQANEDWVYGNHLGTMTVQIGWNIDRHHLLQAYVDDPFEDGSGMRKGNGWDGLWGLQYDNKKPGKQIVRRAVAEFLQTTNQSGPLHWDGGDYPEPVRSQITDKVVGNDSYYSHTFYGSYAHYGMTFGNALLTSPIYNTDGFNDFKDTRVKAWHLGLCGEITDRLSYLVKGSYREGWGTYKVPLSTKHHSFDAVFKGIYNAGPWQFGAAYAFDKGNIYGDCSSLNINIAYHGKIL